MTSLFGPPRILGSNVDLSVVKNIAVTLPGLVMLLVTTTAGGATYHLRLPLQYDRYLPWSARSLGMGGTSTASGGALSLFGLPDRTSQVDCWEVAASVAALSAGRSHVSIESGRTTTFPSAMAVVIRLGPHRLAVGYRRALKDDLRFPDIMFSASLGYASLKLDQYTFGWSHSSSGNASIGLALNAYMTEFSWLGANREYYSLPGGRCKVGYGFSAGITIPVTPEVWLSLAAATKSVTKNTADFLPDMSSADDLELSGAIPSRSLLSVSYHPEPGFVLIAEAVMTGWNTVTQNYEGKLDLGLGAEIRLDHFLDLRLGTFSQRSPLDDLERGLEPSLQDLYFLSAGVGLRWWHLRLDLAGATSRLLTGQGQNQVRWAASITFMKNRNLIY